MVQLQRSLGFLTRSLIKSSISIVSLNQFDGALWNELNSIYKVPTRKYATANKTNIVKSPYPDIVIPKKTFTELIWEQHEKWKSHKAVECGITGESYTYSELLQKSSRIGKALLNEGIRPGDVLAFLMHNKPDYIASILGASKIGLTICSINPLYTPHEIAYQLQNSGAKCLITFPEKLDDAMKALEIVSSTSKNTNRINIISTKCLSGKEAPQLPPNVKSLEEILLGSKIKLNVNEPIKHVYSNLAFISHSSGTTGLPKGVALTHQNVTSSILQMAFEPTTCFKETSNSHQDVIPIVLPIYHNFALEIALDALYHGSKIVTLPKFEEKSFLGTLKDHQATLLFVVPPMMLFLGSESKVTKEHLQYLRCIFSAAAPIGTEDIDRALSNAPVSVNFIQGYGQTEAMCCLTHTPYDVKNFKSVGIPVVNTLIKVVDVKTGSPKEPYQEGELCFQGPQMSLGYLNNLKATAESIDSEGWFHTGDIGYYDEKGYLYIVDRIKELIKVKGYQVAPAELEAILRNHPAVEDAGVVGVPDQRKGEAPVAFIKLKFHSSASADDLKSYLSEKVAPFKMIDQFHFIHSIPRNPSGKILRKNLRLLLS